MKKIDGNSFFMAFRNGAKLVSNKKHHLNEINLFPVPDSDTGNNMSFTLKNIVYKVEPDNSIISTLKSIADNALESARGNSGLILAQFFSGLHSKAKKIKEGKNALNTKDFTKIVKETIPYLYNNVDDPKDGTMLSVIRDWGEEMHSLGENIDDFVLLFNNSMEAALESLEDTKTKLEILKKNNTVDAGAQGFIYFIEGMKEYLANPKENEMFFEEVAVTKEILDEEELEKEEFIIPLEELDYRYCTEVYLISDSSTDEIKNDLHDKGDSLIVASSSNKIRIHIHSNEPAEIVNYLLTKGKIIDQKVDDMQRQAEMHYKKKNDIALVTDSIADLPQKIIDKYQIHVIPLNIVIDEVNYYDKLTIKPDYLYEYIEKAENFPSSSQPTVSYIYNRLEEIASYYDDILVISVSEALSGTGKAFKTAIKKLKEKKDLNISYLNSKLNSGTQGLLVEKAAELIEKGLSLKEINEELEDYRKNSNILVNVNTIEYMVKGGRVSAMKGFLARIFNLKAIISLDENGDGIIWDKAFSRKGVKKKILNEIKRINKNNKIEKYCVVHAGAKEKAVELSNKLKNILGYEAEYIVEISSITTLNSGKNAVAVSYLS